MTDKQKTWLITGASSGLGFELALAVLKAGDRAILAARGVEKAAKEHPEVEKLGGIWLKLDVTSDDAESVVANAIEQSGGRLDVVVNNAGGMVLISLEDVKIEVVKNMVETHVYGALRVMKGVLPTMRAQRSGTVLNMSSFAGFAGLPGTGTYSLCKFALEGMSESLEAELKPFNIRVAIIEAGCFRTKIFKEAAEISTEGIGQHYMDSAVGDTIRFNEELVRRPEELVAGDPSRLAQRLIEIVNCSGLGEGLQDVLRFPFGADSWNVIDPKVKRMVQDFKRTEAFIESANHDSYQGYGATPN